VIAGAEAFSFTEITPLWRRGHTVGRLSVDVDVYPPVDHVSRRSHQWGLWLSASGRKNGVLGIRLMCAPNRLRDYSFKARDQPLQPAHH